MMRDGMRLLERISEVIGKYMALIVLGVAAVSLFLPPAALWIRTSWINSLLMVVMFGMGLTIKPGDFAVVFTRPRDILIGCSAQYIIMPLLAFLLSRLFGLDPALTAGVVLVGTCPGGTSSNVITYLSDGDVALSVGMTSVSTLLAPLMTPAVTWLLLRTTVTVDVTAMFLSIVKVILVPIGLGFLINKLFGSVTQRLFRILPLVSTIAICLIVAAVVSHNAGNIFASGFVILAVVVLHNMLGYLCGFCIARLFRMPWARIKAVSVEIGMQNSGLATSLAGSAFPDLAMATVPGAIFSVWHNISGAVLAGIYRKITESGKQDERGRDR